MLVGRPPLHVHAVTHSWYGPAQRVGAPPAHLPDELHHAAGDAAPPALLQGQQGLEQVQYAVKPGML